MNIVPATQELSDTFYGARLLVSIRGYFLLDEEGGPLGVCGFTRRAKDTMIIFIDAKDGAFADKRIILKFAKMMMEIADKNGWTLIALADETKPTADKFIRHFGFQQNEEGEYVRWPE